MNARHSTRARRHARGGFTLIELLIAIFLLALGLTFVFALFPAGIYCTRDNIDETQAAILARSALARISAGRVIDNFDTGQLAVLDSTAADTVGSLRTGRHAYGDGLDTPDIRDADTSQYCWLATYARISLDPAETATDTSPLDALRVRVAVVRTGPTLNVSHLVAADPAFAGRVNFVAGQKNASLVQAPANRAGLVSGNYVCDVRSGCWYRIEDLKDTGGSTEFDVLVLRRAAECRSDGTFDNALFVPGVVSVFDGIASRSGRD